MQSCSPSNISNIFFPLDKFVFVALNTDDIYGRVGKEMRQGLSAIGSMQLIMHAANKSRKFWSLFTFQ